MNGNGYFSFTKRERTGIITLVIILFIVAVVPKFYTKPRAVAENISLEEMEQLKSKRGKDNYYNAYNKDSPWLKKKYQSNYSERYQPDRYKRQYLSKEYKQFSTSYKRPPNQFSVIDVNTADTSAFIALPGIGSKLATRIISFRDKLGGFYDVRQISEVYGLQDSIFQKIRRGLKCDSGHLRKIDINIADKDILKIHPYIKWNIANALVAYREQHGPFASPNDLERINNIDSDALRKMIPYLSFK